MFNESLEMFLQDGFKSWREQATNDEEIRNLVIGFKKLLDRNQDSRVSLQEFLDGMHDVYYKFHIEKKDFATIQREALEKSEERRNNVAEFDASLRTALIAPVRNLLQNSKWTGSIDVDEDRNAYYQVSITDINHEGKIEGYEILADRKVDVVGAVSFEQAKVILSFVIPGSTNYIVKAVWDLAVNSHRFKGSRIQTKSGRKVIRKDGEKTIYDDREVPERNHFAGVLAEEETVVADTKRDFSIDFSQHETTSVYPET